MMAPSDDDALLRSVALKNAASILRARQRAEEETLRAKEALERKTQELAASLAMMRATLESTADAILVTDSERKVTDFNEKFVDMWRLPRDVMDSREHRTAEDAVACFVVDPGGFLARLDEIYAGSPAETFDVMVLGDERVIERVSRIQMVGDKSVGRVWNYRDITELKRAEDALRKQSEWLRVTLTSIGDAVITTDASGCVTSLNPVAESLTGWTGHDASGKSLDEIFRIVGADSREPCENPALRALREGRIVGLANHTVLIAKDGKERAIDDSAAPIRDDTGAVIGAVLIFRDITDQRRDEENLRRSAAALKESDRRKDEFLALLAHELRNPLAPIRNSVQILRAKNPSSPDLQWATDVIDRQVQQMTRLIDDLLDVSRINTGKIQIRKKRIELADVVSSSVEACRPLIENLGHELNVAIPAGSVPLEGDLARLSQVLLNLLNNAAKYTDPGGRIWLDASQAGGRVIIRVKDTGIGIPPEMLPRIYDMFTQVDGSLERSRGGLGAGLTLVRRLVELHGGTVEGHSQGTGQGSEFIVNLPVAGASSVETPKRRVDPERRFASTPGRRILVVDDNLDAAESLGLLLQMMGNELRIAQDGLEAVQAATAFQPDVVLLDIGLPKLNGYDAARRIRQERGHEVVLVAVTGWGQAEDRLRSKEAGFDHHLIKPVAESALRELLASLA